jgi:heterodisulfide reductase subunit A
VKIETEHFGPATEVVATKSALYVRKVAKVNEALCKGCGSCAAACLNGAISHLCFTDSQILASIEALGKQR